jgi:hypothetical protein
MKRQVVLLRDALMTLAAVYPALADVGITGRDDVVMPVAVRALGHPAMDARLVSFYDVVMALTAIDGIQLLIMREFSNTSQIGVTIDTLESAMNGRFELR